MIKRKGYFLAAILFGLSFMTACSKNLMPPEVLGGKADSVGEQMSQSNDPGSPGGAGKGFGIEGGGSGSGFLSEEDVGESARSGNFGEGGSGSDGDRSEGDPPSPKFPDLADSPTSSSDKNPEPLPPPSIPNPLPAPPGLPGSLDWLICSPTESAFPPKTSGGIRFLEQAVIKLKPNKIAARK
jgi:hypothetical protein